MLLFCCTNSVVVPISTTKDVMMHKVKMRYCRSTLVTYNTPTNLMEEMISCTEFKFRILYDSVGTLI